MARYILAIDQGTTSTRSILFDESGLLKSIDQLEHKQYYPQPGWVEHDPLEILNNCKSTLKKVLSNAACDPLDILGIGITNQRETIVAWDKQTGQPLSNAIVWQDTRTTDICEMIAQNIGKKKIKEITGLPISTYFSATKILWLISNSHKIKTAIDQEKALFGTIDSWLIWNLTGGVQGGIHLTDVTNASRTMLMNLKALDWDEEILGLLNIPRNILPTIVPSIKVHGYAKLNGHNIPISGLLGDQQAALFGQNCIKPGETKNTYGTGCFLLMNTGEKPIQSNHGLITSVAYQVEGKTPAYCLEGSIATTGSLVQWLRDNLSIISHASEIELLASQVPDNGGVYFVPAFSGLFAPHWRSDARGILIGLTHQTNKAHIARAALEATAYQTQDVIDCMEKDSGLLLCSLKVDGGMAKNSLLMQFQSDILDKSIIRPIITETTALGAAYAAGIGVGHWQSPDDLSKYWQQDKTFYPQMTDQVRTSMLAKWKDAISRTFNWV